MDPIAPMQDQSFEMQPEPTPIQDGTPYFMGDQALIKFSGGESGLGPQTYWLVDKENHTIRPFESYMALSAAFGEELEEALNNTVVVNSPTIDADGEITDGILADFTVLGPEYSIKEDGSSKHLAFSSHQLKSRYGKPVDEGVESLATDVLDGFLGLLKSNEMKTGVSGQFLEQLKGDNKLMAFYISALAYGDYTLQDIYSDISRRFHSSKK